MIKNFYINPNIKRANWTEEEYTQDMLDEYQRCSEDPIYFISKYAWIQSLDKGLHRIELRGYQESLIKTFHKEDKVVLLSPRQSAKCFHLNTVVKLRNKTTGEIVESTIGELYKTMSKMRE